MRLKIIICIVIVIFLLGLISYQLVSFNDKKLHVTFCDVGQGDAILIRTPSGSDILVDGGPNARVLDCLHRHMPLWDHTIDLVMLSHPHSDHYTGLLDVVKDYTVKEFGTEQLQNKTQGFEELERLLGERKIPKDSLFKGDHFKIGEVTISILAPTRRFIQETSPGGFIGERDEFASVIPLITFGNTHILLTGDTQNRELLTALQDNNVGRVDLIQVPHHGSKTGLTKEILDITHPSFAVISVGARNRYHHPAPSTITLLEKSNVPFQMTKDRGDIEIVGNGKAIKTSQ